MNLLTTKTLLLLLKNTRKIGNFLFKNLGEISSREGIYIASQKSARWQSGKVKNDLPVDRPVDQRNGHISDRCLRYTARSIGHSLRSTARSTGQHPRVGYFQSVDRAVDQPFRLAMCTFASHRSTGLVDQLLVRSTASVSGWIFWD